VVAFSGSATTSTSLRRSDEVIQALQRLQLVLQDLLATHLVDHLDLGRRQFEVGGDEVDLHQLGPHDQVASLDVIVHQ